MGENFFILFHFFLFIVIHIHHKRPTRLNVFYYEKEKGTQKRKEKKNFNHQMNFMACLFYILSTPSTSKEIFIYENLEPPIQSS